MPSRSPAWHGIRPCGPRGGPAPAHFGSHARQVDWFFFTQRSAASSGGSFRSAIISATSFCASVVQWKFFRNSAALPPPPENRAGPFGWAIHPPRLYLTAVPATWAGGVATVRIDAGGSRLYDIGLYLHEHGDVTGELTLDPARALRASGSAQILGRPGSIEVRVDLPLLPE